LSVYVKSAEWNAIPSSYKSAVDSHLFVNIMHKAIVEKVKSKTANVCVVGLGYVGLPTAVFFAENG